MATRPQPSPPTGIHAHHGPPAVHPPAQVNGQIQPELQAQPAKTAAQHLAALNESVWLQIGMSSLLSFARLSFSRCSHPILCLYLPFAFLAQVINCNVSA